MGDDIHAPSIRFERITDDLERVTHIATGVAVEGNGGRHALMVGLARALAQHLSDNANRNIGENSSEE